jgi:hypothetical protein
VRSERPRKEREKVNKKRESRIEKVGVKEGRERVSVSNKRVKRKERKSQKRGIKREGEGERGKKRKELSRGKVRREGGDRMSEKRGRRQNE